jgi:hypothetical protein
MEFIIDYSGAPAVRFSKNKYISVLPVTKYQFERIIWNTASCWQEYKRLLEISGRVAPHEINIGNLSSVFITGISFDEGMSYAKCMDGRLPTGKEWESAYEFFQDTELFSNALNFLIQSSSRKIDKRLITLLKQLVNIGIIRTEFYNIKEITPEFSKRPYGIIYTKSLQNRTALVTGQPAREVRRNDFGFCVVSG